MHCCCSESLCPGRAGSADPVLRRLLASQWCCRFSCHLSLLLSVCAALLQRFPGALLLSRPLPHRRTTAAAHCAPTETKSCVKRDVFDAAHFDNAVTTINHSKPLFIVSLASTPAEPLRSRSSRGSPRSAAPHRRTKDGK